ncbi:MAG TPA: hypothetical protein IAA30_10255 [Candidatus Treponema faecavium]|nr:hypothetical protein [Candidatus Treponema faecavium]
MKTRTLAEIDAEIAQVKDELQHVRGSETEVYARIVGYYRSVRNWNKGKRDEYNHRKYFVYDGSYELTAADSSCCQRASAVPVRIPADGTVSSYELYMRKTCPNCPPVKEYIAKLPITGVIIDVDSEEGFARAGEKNVCAAPTVIFYDAAHTEIARAHTAAEIEKIIAREPAAIAV